MNERDTRRVNVIVFADDFGAQHPEVFAHAKDAPALLAAMADHRKTLSGYFDELDAAFRTAGEATAERRVARTAVYGTARAVSRFAGSVGQTGSEAKFQLNKYKDRELESLAHNFLSNATEMAVQLQAKGMPSRTLTTLAAHNEAFGKAMAKQKTARETSVGLRSAIEARFKLAWTTLHAMDAIVRHGDVQDAKLIAAWRNGCRIGPSRRTKPDAAAAQTPAIDTSKSA